MCRLGHGQINHFQNFIIFRLVLLTAKQEKVIQVENQPFELQCTVNGRKAEIDKIRTITWGRPDPDVSGSEIPIAANDPNRIINVTKSESLPALFYFHSLHIQLIQKRLTFANLKL
jgi:hypothetical protein